MALPPLQLDPIVRRANGHVPPPPPPGGGGGPDPDPANRRPHVDNLKVAMFVLIGGEVMYFGALVSAFLVLRLSAAVWPPPFQPRLPVEVTAVNTLVLIASSLAMVWATRALRARDRAALVRWLTAAAVLGTTFLTVQGYEWVRLVSFGLTVSSGAYGTTFYGVIGTHALHVLAALVWLVVTTVLVAQGLTARRVSLVRACAMYWHFVVGLWPLLYVAVYL
jgi:heme/copper-type cytochrome/quinol oxidase subunit 3